MTAWLCVVFLVLVAGCRRTPQSVTKPTVVERDVGVTAASSEHPPEDQSALEEQKSKVAEVGKSPAKVPAKSIKTRHKGARNMPSVALYVAERLNYIDKVVTLRVHAEPGGYFNCYFKGRKSSFRHVRLRGDGSAYLDGYVPRDPAGEKLWLRLKKKNSLKMTVKVIMRPETFSDICVGQVDVIGHSDGWNFDVGELGPEGALARRIANARDRTPARNKPSISGLLQNRFQYVDKTVSLRARGRIGRYYQCRYRDAERTHYALHLQGDGYKGLRAYIPRNKTGQELARFLARNEGAALTLSVTIPRGRYDELCPDQVEITEWRKGWDV